MSRAAVFRMSYWLFQSSGHLLKMENSDENVPPAQDEQPVERHPQLSADFEERLKVAREQREKVLATRAATNATPPQSTPADPSGPDTQARRDAADVGPSLTLQAEVASIADLSRRRELADKDAERDPPPVMWPLRWIASAAVAGMLIGSVGTVLVLDSRLAGQEAEIVSSAAWRPYLSRLTASDTEAPVIQFPATSVVAPLPYRLSPDTPALTFRLGEGPEMLLRTPELQTDLTKIKAGLSVPQTAELQSVTRVELSRQPQGVPSDAMPSVELASSAVRLSARDVAMTAPRQDRLQQVHLLLQDPPDRATAQPAFQAPAPADDFDCPICQITAVPAQDQTVILLISDTSSAQQHDDVTSRLSSLGLTRVQSHRDRLGASETNVRYFYDSDAAAAAAIAQLADARLMNLSEMRPRPPVGTIELRLGPDREGDVQVVPFPSEIKG